MKAFLTAAIAAALLFLSGCAVLPDTISTAPASGVLSSEKFVTDLRSAKFNADEAVRIGVIDVNDPMPYCLAAVMKDLGVDGPPPASFQPKYDGVVSSAVVAYIEAQKIKKLGQGVKVDPSCEALVGRIVIDAARATRKAVTPSITGLLRP